MLKIVQLRVTTIVPQQNLLLGEALPKVMKDKITTQAELDEAELDRALNDGYAIVSDQVIGDRSGTFLHIVLHKPDAQTESEGFE